MTDRKTFTKTERQFPLTFESITEGVWDWDIATNTMHFSESWCRSLGYELKEVQSRFSFYEGHIHPEDWPKVKDKLHAHLNGSTAIFECENRIRMKSGDWRWNLDRGNVVAWEPNGQPKRMVGVSMDISASKRQDERETLQRSILQKIVAGSSLEELLNDLCLHVEKIVPSSVCSVMLMDKKTGVLNIAAAPQAFQSACSVLNGMVPGEFSGACGTAAFTGKPAIIIDTDQDPRWDSIREAARPLGIKSCWSIPIYSDGAKPFGTFAISHPEVRHPTTFDLQLLETASYLAGVAIQSVQGREELKISQDKYRDLYDSAPLAYITSKMDGTITNANAQAEQLLGYDREHLISRSVLDLYAPGQNGLEKAQELLAQTKEGQEIEGEHLELRRRDGTHFWVNLTIRIRRDAQGIPIERRGILIDITKHKKVEEKLLLSKFVLDHVGDAVIWAGPR